MDRHQRQRECAAAAATDELLRMRGSEHTAAREARKHAGGMRMGAGQKRARKVQRGGMQEWRSERMGGRSGWMREGGGAGAQVWKGGGTKHCEGQVAEGGLRGASVQNGPRVVLERTKSWYLSKFRSSDSCGLCLFCGFRGDSNNRTE